MERIKVTASKNYTVTIGEGLLKNLGEYAATVVPVGRAMIVTDDTVASLYGDAAEKSLEAAGFATDTFVIPHGERSKNAANYVALLNYAASKRFSRSDVIVALGGGVPGDLAGFAAATLLRGVHFIQVPTTLLAAVDSSVGGKTAIDLDAGKNLAGAFYQPDAVVCDTKTLDTLPREIFVDGMAEVIKYGAIRDAGLLDMLSCDGCDIGKVIARCVQIKADVVSADEYDTGIRQILNFGHTVAHGIEAASRYEISHGSAVAIGICVFSRAAVKSGMCDASVADELIGIIKKYNLPTVCPFDTETIYDSALSDKKNVGGSITLVIPEKRGYCGLHKFTHERLREIIALGLE